MKPHRFHSATLALILAWIGAGLVHAADVTSTAAGDWSSATVWSDAAVPSSANTYVMDGETLNTGTTSGNVTKTATFAGGSLTINAGELQLKRENTGTLNLTVPGFTLAGGSLVFDGNSFNATWNVVSAVDFPLDTTSTLFVKDGNYIMDANLNGALSGAGNILVKTDRANSSDNRSNLYVKSANNTFSGNWTVSSADTGANDRANLNASAANSLGTGTVTLSTRGVLNVAAANGIDSLSGVTLGNSLAALNLTNAWNNPLGRLTLTAGTLNLAASASTISAMTIAGNTVPTGTYDAASLTALGFGGTFLGTGTLTIAGASPSLAVAPTFTFSNNGLTGHYIIRISNVAGDGSTPLLIVGVTTGGSAAGDVSNISYPVSVTAGSGADITFDFTPSAGSGTYTLDLLIASNDLSAPSPRTVKVEIGVLPSPVLLVASSRSLSNNGVITNYSLPLSNSGADGVTALTISGVIATGADAGNVSNIITPASVAAGASGAITFDFTPSHGAGSYSFNLELASNDESAGSPRIVAVTILVSNPAIAVSTTAIDFGSLPATPGPRTATVTITNTGGTENLALNEILSGISGSGAFAISAFPEAIPPGESRKMEITFDPGSAGGFFKGSLIVVSNDSNLYAPIVSLSAYVAPSGPLVAVDFGSSSSPLEAGYQRFVVAEGASNTIGGVSVRIASKNGDITAYNGAGDGNLMTDGAGTTFNGGAGNYVSVQLTGLASGELNLISSHNYPNTLGLPLNILFGELGGTLTTIGSNLNRPSTATHKTTVVAGKTYELRVVENGNANLAYLSGLLLWGSAIPSGYDAFVSGTGLDPATTGAPGLDPDSDGVPTGIEWVVGGSPNNPTAPDTAKLPTGSVVTADPDGDLTFASYFRFSYRRNDLAAADPKTTMIVEYGDDLAGWTPTVNGADGVVIVATDDGAATGIDQVDVYIPTTLAKGGHLFGRLRMVLN